MSKTIWIDQKTLSILLAIWISTHAIIGIPLASWEIDVIHPDDKSNFLTSGLQATAAIVGIIFAISIIAIEHAASNYSPTILEFFKKDKLVWFTVGYGLFTIGFMSMTIMYNWELVFHNSVFFLWNLALLGIYLRYIIERIDPISLIYLIEQNALTELKKIPSKIIDIGNKWVDNDKSGKFLYAKTHTEEIFDATVLSSNNFLLDDVKQLETTIQNVILNSLRKGEYQSTAIGLNSYPKIAQEYIQIIPKYGWHQDKFLEEIVGRLEEFSNRGISQNDLVFLKQVIQSADRLAVVLNSIPSSGLGTDQPAPLLWTIGLLGRIGKNAMTAKMYDGTLAVIRNLGNLGTLSIVKHRNDSLVAKQLNDIGQMALLVKDSFTVSECIKQYFVIIQSSIYLKNEMMLSLEFDELAKLIENTIKLRLNSNYIVGLFWHTSELGIMPCIELALTVKNEEYPQIETHWREKFEKKVVSSVIKLVSKIGVTSKENDRLIANYCSKSLVRITEKCVTQNFITIKNRHEEEITKIIWALTSMQYYEPEWHSSYNQDIATSLAEVAILCLENDYQVLAEKCILGVHTIAMNTSRSDKHGYESNRILRELNLVGCYSIMRSNKEILDLVVEKIVNYELFHEQQFNEKKFSDLPRDELGLDTPEWAVDDFENHTEVVDVKEIMDKKHRRLLEIEVTRKKLQILQKQISQKRKPKTGRKSKRKK